MNNTTIESPEVLGSRHTGHDFVYGFAISFGILLIIIFLTYFANMFNHMYHANHPPPPSDHNTTTATEAAGLDDATLVTFPTLLYSEAKPHKDETTASGCGSGSGCSICLADYKATDMLRLLPECGHMYHLMCIDQWFRLHPTCPICRNSPLTTPFATPHQSLQVDHISRLSVVVH